MRRNAVYARSLSLSDLTGSTRLLLSLVDPLHAETAWSRPVTTDTDIDIVGCAMLKLKLNVDQQRLQSVLVICM